MNRSEQANPNARLAIFVLTSRILLTMTTFLPYKLLQISQIDRDAVPSDRFAQDSQCGWITSWTGRIGWIGPLV